MHLLYIHQYFATPSMGGATRSFEFAKRLASRGHRVTVLTGRTLDESAQKELPEGVTVISSHTPYSNTFGTQERIRSFIEFALRATRMGWSCRPDVIFATSTPLTVGVPALVLSWKHRVPFVFEVRDLWPEAPIQLGVITNPVLIRLLRWFERLVYRRAAHVVTLSPGMQSGVVAAGVPETKTTLIPNASDVSLFQPGPIDVEFLVERGLPLRPTIAYTGALGRANAIELLGEVAVRLQELNAEVQILVAGDGQYLPYLENLITERRLDTLVTLGRVSKHDVVRLLKASAAGLVLFSDVPVLQTNSPNKFFDLLAAGRPIITNMRGWIADLVRRHRIGYVAEGEDVEGLADAIIQAASLREFESMAENARRLAETEFNRDVLADKLEEVLRRAAAREN